MKLGNINEIGEIDDIDCGALYKGGEVYIGRYRLLYLTVDVVLLDVVAEN